MQFRRIRVFDRQSSFSPEVKKQETIKRSVGREGSARLRAFATLMLTLASCMPSSLAAQTPAGSKGPDVAASNLPAAPAPTATEPFDLGRIGRDFSKPFAGFFSINKYRATMIDKASFTNSLRLNDMVKEGKIYLSLSDAIALAIENNYDIAISRYNLDIADTDILRTKTGAAPLGVPSGLVANTLTGAASTLAPLTSAGGPGGTSVGIGGAGAGAGGIVFLHSIEPGAASKSYGIEVAKLAGLPAAVIERARHILRQHEKQERQSVQVETAEPEPMQLTIFTPLSQRIVDRLEAVDVNSLTPLQALNLLEELQQELKEKA